MTLCLLGTVLDRCSPPIWHDNEEIQLTVERDRVLFEELRKLEDHRIFVSQIADPDLQSQFAGGQSGALPQGVTFTLTVPRIVKNTVVARNLADLIAMDSATWRTPSAYFLIEEEETKRQFCFEGSLELAPKKVKRYHDAIRLWERFGANAEHTTPIHSLLFFGKRRRIEISPSFDLNDLGQDIEIEKIEQFLDNEERPDIRKIIFKSAVDQFWKDPSAKKAFSDVLRSSDSFAQRLDEHWKIYVANYSPDKANRQAVIKHLEFTEKLEKIISAMEAKSLTIPAAVLLAVKEVQFGAGWTTLNTMIFAASLLYLSAMGVAHFSQHSTLKLLKRTIDETKKDLMTALKENNPILIDSFVSLESRRKNSSVGSWFMFVFSFVPFLAVIYAAFCASPTR